MKANQKSRENDYGAAPVVGTILMLPIAMVIIGAIILWSGNMISHIVRTSDQIEQDISNFANTNITYTSLSGSDYKLIWDEDFEKNELTWIKTSSDGIISPYHEDHYHTKGHSAKLETDSNTISIMKLFHGESYERLSVEIAFTIDFSETCKIFSMYQNNEENNAIIKIDMESQQLLCYYNGGFEKFADINLLADEHCWHHMQLVVDYENDDSTKNPHYAAFIIDGKEYSLTDYNLNNFDSTICMNPQTINVSYTSISTGIALSLIHI